MEKNDLDFVCHYVCTRMRDTLWEKVTNEVAHVHRHLIWLKIYDHETTKALNDISALFKVLI